MNQRIRELAEQANLEIDPAHPDHNQKVLEKFAELIIRKCMACSTWVGKNNTNTVEPIHTAQAINQRIKQHFGVEE
jgi:hypothetical protein